jgi:hypothetical protein
MSQFAEIHTGLLERMATVTPQQFDALALDLFRFQALRNPLYRHYLQLLRIKIASIEHRTQIPHLPITLFKSHKIKTGAWKNEVVFTSSGTTGAQTSKHFVRDLEHYLGNARRGFEAQYGPLEKYSFLALLPNYLERKGSSLVAMADDFIARSNAQNGSNFSGFFLHDHDALLSKLHDNQRNSVPTVLLGVTYALLDFSQMSGLRNAITQPELLTIMETGGMKGRRKEMTRAEVHTELKTAFGVSHIHSEYGMTELLSQAYAPQNGLFLPSPTLRVHTTELNDPFCKTAPGKSGIINITDLANIDSCAFLATEDLGRVHPNGNFEVIGRADISEMRGCNLMVE